MDSLMLLQVDAGEFLVELGHPLCENGKEVALLD